MQSPAITVALIKPDAIRDGHAGAIITAIEEADLRVAHLRQWYMNARQAEEFYAEHRGRVFFEDLVKFMASGPVVSIVLWCEDRRRNVIGEWRDLIGHTDPPKRAPHTLRAKYASPQPGPDTLVHGSDSPAAADREVSLLAAWNVLTWAEVEHLHHGPEHAR